MCSCASLGPAIYLASKPPHFDDTLVRIANGFLCSLCRCNECGQLWRIDTHDEHHTQLAVKVPSTDRWESFDSRPFVKELMVSSRGGVTDAKCIWSGCKEHAVSGEAYCVEHLCQRGARQ